MTTAPLRTALPFSKLGLKQQQQVTTQNESDVQPTKKAYFVTKSNPGDPEVIPFPFDRMSISWPTHLSATGESSASSSGAKYLHLNTVLKSAEGTMPDQKNAYVDIGMGTKSRISAFVNTNTSKNQPVSGNSISNLKARHILFKDFPTKAPEEEKIEIYYQSLNKTCDTLLDHDAKLKNAAALFFGLKAKKDMSKPSQDIFNIESLFEYDLYGKYDDVPATQMGDINPNKSPKIPIMLWTRNANKAEKKGRDGIMIPGTDKEILTKVYDWCDANHIKPITTWEDLRTLIYYEKGSSSSGGAPMFDLDVIYNTNTPTLIMDESKAVKALKITKLFVLRKITKNQRDELDQSEVFKYLGQRQMVQEESVRDGDHVEQTTSYQEFDTPPAYLDGGSQKRPREDSDDEHGGKKPKLDESQTVDD